MDSTCSGFCSPPAATNSPSRGEDGSQLSKDNSTADWEFSKIQTAVPSQNGVSVLVGCLTLNCMLESPTVNRAVCGEKLRLSRAVAWALQLACEATMERDCARKEKREQALIACIDKVRKARDSARMAVAALEHHCLEHGCDGLAGARPSEG